MRCRDLVYIQGSLASFAKLLNMYMGKRVARKFGKNIFNGIITKFMPIVEDDDVDFWHVVYDDGDEEDWTKADVDDGMALYKKIRSN